MKEQVSIKRPPAQSIQGHSVQFYLDDIFLTESVVSFIREGLQANETVMVVATAPHREELRKVLTSQERTHDKLRFFHAGDLLSAFTVDSQPNELQFKKVIGGMIGQAMKLGQVRVFGEMAAILWAEGQTHAAIRLEKLWNSLMEKQTFTLLCAYPLAQFYQEKDLDSVLAISRLHSHSSAQSTLA